MHMLHVPEPIESIDTTRPFVMTRRIAFRDCNPAGVVYAPRFFDPIATSASEAFMNALMGRPKQRVAPFDNIGFPAKAVRFVFHDPVEFDASINIEVSVGAIRTHTFDVVIEAFLEAERKAFDANLTLIAIAKGEWCSVEIPPKLRTQLAAFQKSQDKEKPIL